MGRLSDEITLNEAPLTVAPLLANNLFSHLSSVVLCSATLATESHFVHLRQQLGLTKDHLPSLKITENLLPSPFPYTKQALFGVPTDIPFPTTKEFLPAAIVAIPQIISATKGNALVLFTSYHQMEEAYITLSPHLPLLRQGDEPRYQLLETFKKKEGTSLFATSSFWEGVDVVGDALRCVVLVKLPFPVPTEPIAQARMEALEKTGESSFWRYSIPKAIVKFKQGFGRLIRNNKDRGCIICLDARLINKPYGKSFLNSIPPCRNVFAPENILIEQISSFLWGNQRRG